MACTAEAEPETPPEFCNQTAFEECSAVRSAGWMECHAECAELDDEGCDTRKCLFGCQEANTAAIASCSVDYGCAEEQPEYVCKLECYTPAWECLTACGDGASCDPDCAWDCVDTDDDMPFGACKLACDPVM